ncbi:MAG: SpoIIE family protein phosphatase [Lachnospiraceae bacterium]|nr:SpoIIE family protein phosphatase [Lachnospiraceae bacterium]
MKKLFGIRPGGLQRKITLLVLTVLIATVLVLMGISEFQSRMLTRIVGETRIQQQEAISKVSEETMDQTMQGALVNSTKLQANIADSDFTEIVNDTYMLQSMAQGLIENRNSLTPAEVSIPDPSLDGTPSAMVMSEEGVDYTRSRFLGTIAHMATPMIAMLDNSDKITACYVGLSDGTFFCVDTHTSNRYDESGKLKSFAVRERPWYKGAIETGELYFTGIEKDAFSGAASLTCSAPVIVGGKTYGVVGIDITLDNMQDFIHSVSTGDSYAFIVSQNGEVLLAPEGSGLFETGQELGQSDNAEVSTFIQEALEGTTRLAILTLDGKQYYAAGSPMSTVGWAVIALVDKTITEQPEQLMLAEYDRINEEATAAFRAGSDRMRWAARLAIVLLLLLSVGIALYASRRFSRPIEEMTESIIDSSQTGKLFEMKDSYRTNDEIEVLALSFDELSKKTKQYIEDITEITKEKERVSTELNMARQIQSSMMPHIFPAFPDRHEFDIYATMDPAKEVGGDFYDFFLIDEDHLCMVMADVSGKGIPAALFMMISKVILQSCAMLGRSPAEILNKTNEALCSSNQVEMFVTVWLGILEISTGKITAANAGHEYPAMTVDGTFELLKGKHGFVVGGLENVRYHEYELQMKPGDKLFLYTDGVPEATDEKNQMFGTDRMLEALNKDKDAASERILENVRKDLDAFVSGAEQFDDLTMLCIEYNGAGVQSIDETAHETAGGENGTKI